MIDIGLLYEIGFAIKLERIAGNTWEELEEYVKDLRQEGCKILSAWSIKEEFDPWKK